MNPDSQQPTPQPTQPSQPVAYDAQGRPLYAHPPVQERPGTQTPVEPQSQPQPVADSKPEQPSQTVVHFTRSLEPEHPVISEEVQKKHDDSKRHFPHLNLSPGEYVIAAVRRHPIGLILPLALGTLVIAVILTILTAYPEIATALALTGPLAEPNAVVIPALVLVAVVGFAMFVSYYVYVNNKFFLTNESVIQEIQYTLFSRLEQTVSLANIEDASFTQLGVLQSILDYGDIRLSTEGDETTYRFSYVASPKTHIARLNNAVEAFKNGRPVSDN